MRSSIFTYIILLFFFFFSSKLGQGVLEYVPQFKLQVESKSCLSHKQLYMESSIHITLVHCEHKGVWKQLSEFLFLESIESEWVKAYESECCCTHNKLMFTSEFHENRHLLVQWLQFLGCLKFKGFISSSDQCIKIYSIKFQAQRLIILKFK